MRTVSNIIDDTIKRLASISEYIDPLDCDDYLRMKLSELHFHIGALSYIASCHEKSPKEDDEQI